MSKYVELPKEHITFYGDTEEKKKNEKIFDLSLEVDRLWQENKRLKEDKDSWHIVAQKNYNEMQDKIDKAIKCIEDFLCTEEYIKSDPEATANNYVELLNILEEGKK